MKNILNNIYVKYLILKVNHNINIMLIQRIFFYNMDVTIAYFYNKSILLKKT